MTDQNLSWRKSSFSASNGDCVELAKAGGTVFVRDSKDPGGPVLTFTPAEIRAWINGCKAGEFDAVI